VGDETCAMSEMALWWQGGVPRALVDTATAGFGCDGVRLHVALAGRPASAVPAKRHHLISMLFVSIVTE
jgi:hypothetical protein